MSKTEETKKVAEEKKTSETAAKKTAAKSEKKAEKKVAADVNDMSEDQIKFARINIRKKFNEKFSKWAEIAPEDADDAFIAEAKKDFDDEVEVNKNAKFEIATADDGLALKSAEFLKEWNEKFNHWTKGQWRGLIRFNVVISDIIEDLKKNPEKSLEIDYQTLIFLYYTMMEPQGTGLQSAREMAKFENYNEATDAPFETDIPVTYSGILEKVKMHVDGLKATDKKLVILKQRLELAYGGLKMNLKISSLEEFVEFCDAINAENVSSSSDEIESQSPTS